MTSASGAPCSSCRSVSPLCLCAPPFCATVSVSGGSGPVRAEAGGTERHVQRGTERHRASSLALCPSAALPPLPLYLPPRSPPPPALCPPLSLWPAGVNRPLPPPPLSSVSPSPPPPGSCTGESISRADEGWRGSPQRELGGHGPSNHSVVQIAGEGAMDNETRLH